jgi:hypothetical protein
MEGIINFSGENKRGQLGAPSKIVLVVKSRRRRPERDINI